MKIPSFFNIITEKYYEIYYYGGRFMRKLKKMVLIFTLFSTLALFAGISLAADASAPSADQVLKALLNEYKVTFFKHRMTSLVLKDKQIQVEMAQKLAATPEGDFGPKEVAVVRDYLRSISTFKNVDTNQYLGEKMPLLVKGLFSRINEIYTQKLEDLSEKISTLTVISALKNDSKTLDALTNYFKRQTGVSGAAFASLAAQINNAIKFQMNSKQTMATNYFKDIVKNFDAFGTAFKKVDLTTLDSRNIEKIKKYSHKKIWKIVSAAILEEIADLPSEVERIGKIDVNKASESDLLNIPGVSKEMASKIINFRNERGGVITSVHELDSIKGIGAKTVRKLKTALYAKDFVMPEKEWTVMCFINGDNNLEMASLLGINVMERVGSTENMNVVVQIDRIGVEQFGSPEEAQSNTMLDGNWSTCRRYFVQKDSRLFELNSILLEKMGEVDMGAYKNFVEFCKSTITRFPAKHYVVLISNHGSEFGIGGISFDDQSKNHMSTIHIGQALSEVRDFIKNQNGNDLIDLMVFDCCLLAKMEVVKEIADYVHGVYACENVQINWYAYDNFLRTLTSKPDLKGNELAFEYLKSYVDYMRGWVKRQGLVDKMVLTSTAFDMTKFKAFEEAFVKFSSKINEYSDVNPEAVEKALKSVKNLSDVSVFDLIDFVKKVKAEAKDNKEMVKSCDELLKAYGEPVKKLDHKEFHFSAFSDSSFVMGEAHNFIEETGNGLSIGIFTKPTWLTIAAAKPDWGLNETNVMGFLNKFKSGDYPNLKLSQESEWDEFMIKMIDKNN